MSIIEIIPKPSRLFLIISFVVHILAILAICLSNVGVILKIFLVSLILLNCYYLCYYMGLQHSSNIIVKCLKCNGEWILFDCCRKEHLAQLLNDTLITPFLIILNFRLLSNNYKKSLVLFKDSLDKDTFRKLQVSLICRLD